MKFPLFKTPLGYNVYILLDQNNEEICTIKGRSSEEIDELVRLINLGHENDISSETSDEQYNINIPDKINWKMISNIIAENFETRVCATGSELKVKFLNDNLLDCFFISEQDFTFLQRRLGTFGAWFQNVILSKEYMEKFLFMEMREAEIIVSRYIIQAMQDFECETGYKIRAILKTICNKEDILINIPNSLIKMIEGAEQCQN